MKTTVSLANVDLFWEMTKNIGKKYPVTQAQYHAVKLIAAEARRQNSKWRKYVVRVKNMTEDEITYNERGTAIKFWLKLIPREDWQKREKLAMLEKELGIILSREGE